MKKKTSASKKKSLKTKDSNSKKNMLKEALDDLNSEILNITKEKKRLTEQIGSADKSLEDYREFEKKLQEKIAALLEREASLKERKKQISMKQEKMADKLLKIEKIKQELGDI